MQYIWNGVDEYVLADACLDAVEPDWPVMDEGNRPHWPQFDGQKVIFHGTKVHFGFQVPYGEVSHAHHA